MNVGQISALLPREYLKLVLNFEGGYSNHPADRGGETCRGITYSALQTAIKSGLIPSTVTIKSLLTDLDSVHKIYEVNYYIASKSNLMPHPLAFAHFDASVNHGKGNSGKFLQRTLNKVGYKLDVDGGIGSKTLAALQDAIFKVNIMNLTSTYNYIRLTFYNAIVENNPKQKVFYRGWMNRLNKVKEYCGVK